MTKHTPGPWRVSAWPNSKATIRADDGHGKVATVHVRYTMTDNLAEHAANARLIAAAPITTETLRRFVIAGEELGWDVDPALAPLLNDGRDALAKAEGGAS